MNFKAQKLELVKKQLKKSSDRIEVPAAKLASIKRGLDQIKKGEIFSHNNVRKIYAKWL